MGESVAATASALAAKGGAWRAGYLALLLALLGLLPPGSAGAQEALIDDLDFMKVVFGGSVLHDTNLFRIPDSIDPQARLGPGRSDKSELLTLKYVGLRADKAYSQQH